MKHLRKINEGHNIPNDGSEYPTFRDICTQIKYILLDIKDDYPGIDGEILDIEGSKEYGDSALYMIVLDCENIKIEGYGTIQHYRDKIKFMNLILDSCKRLEDALNVTTFIPNLDDFTHWQHSSIKITLYKK